jgi:ABC-type nitrate/sulfonate/bicarbonate transport system substrate-binding protein
MGKLSAKKLILPAFLIGLLLLAAGCGKKEEVQKGRTPVVAVGSQWYGHIPVWVGIERGTFDKHGFEVSWRFIGKSMDRLNAISSGDAQFASLGQVAMLSAMAQGNNRFYWVGNQDIAPGFEGLVAQPGITSFEQLRGKTVGLPFGSSVDLTARMLLKDHGLDPEKDIQLVNLEVGDVPAVFRAGNVDAAIIWEPGFSQLKEVEGATVLGMDTDTPVYKKFGTMTGPDVLILGKAWCDEDPSRARKFLKAYFESLEWVKENPDSSAVIVHEKYIVQDVDLIKENLLRFVWQTLEDQKRVMSDEGIFGQTEYILQILHQEMKAIPIKPNFRQWVPMHILPFDDPNKIEPSET